GAATAAQLTRSARWEGFEQPSRLAACALGGLLMGFGGALAAGCSIGQGLSGLSTLAYASLPAMAGILLGSWAAIQFSPRA
ncbi:MAG: YeeE/YedE thiosulfate transporter family protein, partial [Comamonas sp.]